MFEFSLCVFWLPFAIYALARNQGSPDGDQLCDMQDFITFVLGRSKEERCPVPHPKLLTEEAASSRISALQDRMDQQPTKVNDPLPELPRTAVDDLLKQSAETALEDTACISGFFADTDAAATYTAGTCETHVATMKDIQADVLEAQVAATAANSAPTSAKSGIPLAQLSKEDGTGPVTGHCSLKVEKTPIYYAAFEVWQVR